MSGKKELNNEKTNNEKINNKKFIISLISVTAVAVILGLVVVLATKPGKFEELFSDVKITVNEANDIKLEKYSNGDFSMNIPKGWKVEVGITSFDRYSYYAFTAYNPENPSYRLFFNMKTDGYVRTASQKKVFSWYKDSPFYVLPHLDPLTVENFYKNYTVGMDYFYGESMNIPRINDFKEIENLGKDVFGGDIIRATYKDENGKIVDGIFTTNLRETSLYYAMVVAAYNTMFFTAEEGHLIEWQDTLSNCLGSIEFTQSFVDGFYKSQDNLMKTIKANQKIYDETSNIITEGWNARQNTYDIISQKQSDATLGYERVYDTKTGEIYKADNGFMDNDWNGRYEKVTDDMYNLPTSGYIKKK